MNEEWDEEPLPNGLLPLGMRSVLVAESVRDNETGEVHDRIASMYMYVGDAQPSTYIYEEGNYACDCNRAIFFRWGEAGVHEPCGFTRYSVQLKNAKTSRVFYDEFDPQGA